MGNIVFLFIFIAVFPFSPLYSVVQLWELDSWFQLSGAVERGCGELHHSFWRVLDRLQYSRILSYRHVDPTTGQYRIAEVKCYGHNSGSLEWYWRGGWIGIRKLLRSMFLLCIWSVVSRVLPLYNLRRRYDGRGERDSRSGLSIR